MHFQQHFLIIKGSLFAVNEVAFSLKTSKLKFTASFNIRLWYKKYFVASFKIFQFLVMMRIQFHVLQQTKKEFLIKSKCFTQL